METTKLFGPMAWLVAKLTNQRHPSVRYCAPVQPEGRRALREWLLRAIREEGTRGRTDAQLLYIPETGGFAIMFYPIGSPWAEASEELWDSLHAHYSPPTEPTDFDDGE